MKSKKKKYNRNRYEAVRRRKRSGNDLETKTMGKKCGTKFFGIVKFICFM